MPTRKKHASTRARPNKASTAATLPAEIPQTDYTPWTLPELRDALRERGLKVGGNKPDLIARLHESDSDHPRLPDDRQWHPKVVEFWNDAWGSPMRIEWTDSDLHNMFILALLYQDLWTADSSYNRNAASAQILRHRASLGLDPYSRRRLEWTIEKVEGEADANQARRERRERSKPAPIKSKTKGKDPYAALRAVP